MPTTDLSVAFDMPPADAVAYFRAKGFEISDNWWEVWQRSHAKAFTVAKAMRMDVLETIRAQVDSALVNGTTAKQFVDELALKLKDKGWWGKQTWVDSAGTARNVQLGSVHRLRNIYRNNLQTAYMSGRYQRQLANATDRPYWMYIAVMDGQTRPDHANLSGKVFRYNDPIWQYIYPPNGWGCRCRIRALTAKQLERMGVTLENGNDYIQQITAEAGIDTRTGEVIQVDHVRLNLPGGKTMTPDVGWAYNPGEAAFGTDQAVAKKLASAQSIELRTQLVQALNNSELRQSQFASWASKALDTRRAGNSVQALGFMTPTIQQAVTTRLGRPPTALLAIGEKQLLHADSAKHIAQGKALSKPEYMQLPRMLANPQAVLWDSVNNNLLYIYPSTENELIKVVINTGWNMKKQQPLDTVINTYKVAVGNLTQQQYELLEGEL
ncbi:minor capsid protein [Alishewanella sp. 16-MA]|uniref:Minor capsid protein n=2 Tax=Gammaproteobacteria TaxID=1236 RepID=A0ABS8C1G1_9ALTE|nr:phage minor head protein [Alishewanella maricola]MCB5226167.1 minor capsid protein [Alishewanella maricola]